MPESDYQDQQAAFLIWSAAHITSDGVVVYNHKPRRRNGTVMIYPAEWFLCPEVRDCLTLVEEVIWDRGSTHNHAPALNVAADRTALCVPTYRWRLYVPQH